MKKYPYIKAAWLLFFISFFLVFYLLDWNDYFQFNYIQKNFEKIETYYQDNVLISLILFSILYVFVTSFSIPIATLLSLVAGALFGFLPAFFLVSLSSTLGATFSFLMSRYLFKNYLERKFTQQLSVVNRGLDKEGGYYLFAMRLIPLFPFFLINILMGLTRYSLKNYFIISFLGMVPGTIVYVNAGRRLGEIKQIDDIYNIYLVLSFALIGILPLVSKKILSFLKDRKNEIY